MTSQSAELSRSWWEGDSRQQSGWCVHFNGLRCTSTRRTASRIPVALCEVLPTLVRRG